MKLTDLIKEKQPFTALLYCAPGVGKSTALGLIGEKSKGKTLVLDVDRTFVPTMAKDEVVHDFSKFEVLQVDNINTWTDWTKKLTDLNDAKEAGKLTEYENICVDNISELERCILSDLGRQGKNKGVPAQADYQYMQFKLMDSLRFMKSLGLNVIWTAWETTEDYVTLDGTCYTRSYPKISKKIVDNVCGLCEIVGKIIVNKDGDRGVVMEATQNIYAKNQIDTRKICNVKEFIK